MQITNSKIEILKRFKRIATVILTVVMVLSVSLTVLSSCGKTATKKDLQTVHSDSVVSDLAHNLASDSTAREYFTAAINGYNMLAEGFDDNNLEAMRNDSKYYVSGINMEAIRAILLESSASWSVRPEDSGEGYVAYIKGTEKTTEEPKLNEDGTPVLDSEGQPVTETVTVTEGGLTEDDANAIYEKLKTSIVLENSGVWDAIMRGIGTALKWVSDHVAFHSYLLALFIFAVLIEIVLLPLGIRQQKNSIKQAKLRPKEMAIRNKYKGRNDQATMQKMQAEIQELYQREHFSPMGGCLPLLVQLPIVFILYYIVIDPLHYMMGLSGGVSQALSTFATTAKAAGGLGLSVSSTNGTIEVFSHINESFLEAFKSFGYYTNGADAVRDIAVGNLPNFNIGSVNFGLVPAFAQPYVLLIVPVLTFGVYFGSMKLTRLFTYQPPQANDQQMGCSNNIMDIVMPLFSVFIAFRVPAVVGIYWIFKSMLSTLKQFILSRMMPAPKFTDADYKAAEKEMGGKAPKPIKKYNRETGNPRVRSLHHIDDEDYEDTREKAQKRKEAEADLEDFERPSAPKTAEPTREEIAAARLKLGRKEENKKRHQEDDDTSEGTKDTETTGADQNENADQKNDK